MEKPKIENDNLPIFSRNCLKTFEEAKEILKDRRDQYDDNVDSWANSSFNALRTTFKLINGRGWTIDEYRTIASASLVDLKISRLNGEFKADTAIDLMNYLANWVAEMEALKIKYGYEKKDLIDYSNISVI